MPNKLEETTVRDFGGGWDLSDSDKSLSSKYQVVSDNIVRGTDGHFRVRYGNKLFTFLYNGTETVVASASYNVVTTNASSVVRIGMSTTGMVTGDHLTITGFTGTLNGVTAEMMNRTHGAFIVDGTNLEIYVRGVATSTGSAARTMAFVKDKHVLSGRTIFGRYYKDRLIVFAENGEIAAVDINGTATRIWSYGIARALTLAPWGFCQRVSAEIIRGRLIAVNGASNDKPIAIQDTTVNYLVDAATLSNGAIPRADFVIAASQYIILVSTEYGPTKLEIGARNTVMTASREASPDDAVEIDVGMMTQTIDTTILGASVIRSKVFLGFSDRTMLGTLGLYTEIPQVAPAVPLSIHEPDFSDNIAEFGTFSHHSIISLGNDLFCVGMNGVNSLELSRQSGEFLPQTISDLIHPALLRHLHRLTEDDRRFKVFAVFDVTSRSYMLFAPKYSAITTTLGASPLVATETLQEHNLMYLKYTNHSLDEGDSVVIAGATNFDGNLLGSAANGTRVVRHIVNKDVVVIETSSYPINYNQDYGGTAVTITPVNDGSIGYIYEYNPRLKIRRWSRFKGLDFDWGARSQFNKLFFGKNGKIWQMGDANNPFSADKIGEYDKAAYATSFAYTVDTRVRDTVDGLVYICLIAHTSHASNTFPQARLANPTFWEEYFGEEIPWEMKTAWSDFDKRKTNKQIELVSFDTEGSATFTFSIFANDILRDFESLLSDPLVGTDFAGQNTATDFVAAGTPGFGAGEQPYGGGRNTANEWLHSMPAFGKIFQFRFTGSSIHPLKVSAVTLYYHQGDTLT